VRHAASLLRRQAVSAEFSRSAPMRRRQTCCGALGRPVFVGPAIHRSEGWADHPRRLARCPNSAWALTSISASARIYTHRYA
jgi:hypothetical protein